VKNAYQKLMNIERYASRRAKVFAKRARKSGWHTESIVVAIKYGFKHFRV